MSTTKTFHPALILLALVALAMVLHLPVLGLSFFSDDFSVIHRIGVQGDLGTGSFFRPLPDWTLYLNYVVTGPSPTGFRVVNVFLLGFNGWLVFLLGRNLLATPAGPWNSTALFAGVLFICYPFHNEPQLWIIGRSTAMATAFTLLALLAATGPANLPKRCLAVGTCTALGTLCYELALLLPLLLIVSTLLQRNSRGRSEWLVPMVAAAVVAANLVLRSVFTGAVANSYGTSFFAHGIVHYVGATAKVLARLVLPPHPDWTACLSLLLATASIIVLLGILLLRRTANDREARSRLITLAVLLLVACGIGIIGGVSTRTSESDRFLYLPSTFLSMILAYGLSLITNAVLRYASCGGLIITMLFAMHANHAHWKHASATIDRIVEAMPHPPPTGHLLVSGLPGDHEGAFVFRHGLREALLFAGRDGAHVVRADTVWHDAEDTSKVFAFSAENMDDTLRMTRDDRLVRWNGQDLLPFTP